MFALATAENYSYKALCGNSFDFHYTSSTEKPAMQIRIGGPSTLRPQWGTGVAVAKLVNRCVIAYSAARIYGI